MWTRALLKENAKIAFKRNYWTCVIVSVILMLVGGGTEGGRINWNFNTDLFGGTQSNRSINITGTDFIWATAITLILLIAMVVGIVFAAFVTNIIMVGGKRYFMENREHKTLIGQAFYGFQCGNYMNLVKTMFLKDLYIFGWTLLFIIPGIIKGYSYRLVPYILAERPDMATDRAIDLSREMMNGNKLKALVLDWSFILWDIANVFTIGILGIFYLNPYKHATFAEFYTAVKAEALHAGIVNEMELPGVVPRVMYEQEAETVEVVFEEDIFAED